MDWRFIPLQSCSAAMNMAIDEMLAEYISSGAQNPAIRFYAWNPAAVSLGIAQAEQEINVELCEKKKIPIVRRMTGGAAVYHDRNDLTYSVIAPLSVLGKNVQEAYAEICSWILSSLEEMGIKASLKNTNDIMCSGKKISGNAARLQGGIYLQHGTLIYDIDHETMPQVLNIAEQMVRKKVTSLSEQGSIHRDDTYEILKRNFLKNKTFHVQELQEDEIKRAEEIAEAKYKNYALPEGITGAKKGACYVTAADW